ncbi:RNA polymerase sigma factor [Microscilla marina]|uniref:RNA polymerase ECF-type sigma factor n=1 Tax=Microscilla marina ATCC 23134 TaxID=313606 RepID=A1ZIB7_MICM2|nr:sigma factor [Microscilla marina]EAY29785.1 RNA polymerase ECF-type sigma factor [Microscilla marina ATCC 23134]
MKNDELFWQKLIEGDKNTVKEIFQLNVPLLVKYGCRFTSNDTIIDECIVEVFLNLWKNRQALDKKGTVKIYLMKSLSQQIKANQRQRQLKRA